MNYIDFFKDIKNEDIRIKLINQELMGLENSMNEIISMYKIGRQENKSASILFAKKMILNVYKHLNELESRITLNEKIESDFEKYKEIIDTQRDIITAYELEEY